MTDKIDTKTFIPLDTNLGKIQAFADTGANIDCINLKLANELWPELILPTRTFSALSANNTQIQINKYIPLTINTSNNKVNTNMFCIENLPYKFLLGRITIHRIGWVLQPSQPTEIHLQKTIDPLILPEDFETQIERNTFHFTDTEHTTDSTEVCIVQAEHQTIWDQMLLRQSEQQYIHELFTLEEQNTQSIPTPSIPEHIDNNIKNQFFEIFDKYKESIAAKHQYDLGKISNFEFKLTLKDPNKRPPLQPFFRCSPEHAQEIDRQIELMLQHDIAEISDSDVASPMFGVPKKNGELRCCVDYRWLNKLTLGYHQPLPRIEELLYRVAQGKWYASLDIRQAFLNVPVESETRKLMAFRTPNHHVQPTRMLFGVKGAPAFQQMIMNHILGHIKNVLVYIDDIIIFAQSQEELIETIEKIFDILQHENIKLNFAKCSFFEQEIEFLGRIISYKQIKVHPKYIKKVLNLKSPKTKKELQMVLGVIGWIAPWIPHLAHISSILHDLKKDKVKFVWTPKHEQALQKIKRLVETVDFLTPPDIHKQFILWTDASEVARGACLAQKEPDSNDYQLCEFWSKKFTSQEKNWHVYSQELSALLLALDHWRLYIQASPYPTIVYTDHHNLLHLYNLVKLPNLNQRLHRWASMFQEFDLIIRYIPGKNNILADYLSRVEDPLIPASNTDNTNLQPSDDNKENEDDIHQPLDSNIAQLGLLIAGQLCIGPSFQPQLMPTITRSQMHKQKQNELQAQQIQHILDQDTKTRQNLNNPETYDSDTPKQPPKPLTNRPQIKKRHRSGDEFMPAKQKIKKPEINTPNPEIPPVIHHPQKIELPDLTNLKNESQIRAAKHKHWNETIDHLFNLLKKDTSHPISFHDDIVLQTHQENDSLIQNALNYRYCLTDTNEYKEAKEALSPQLRQRIDNRLLKEGNLVFYNGKRWLPHTLQPYALHFYHTRLATHIGTQHTLDAIQETYCWPGISRDVREYVKSCHTCQLSQGHIDPNLGYYQQFAAHEINEIVHIDVVGPLPPTPNGYKYILTMCDRFSKYAIFTPMYNQTAQEAAFLFFQHWICRIGTPKKLISDRGSLFRAELFKYFEQLFGIKPTFTSSYNPRANGALERIHAPLKKGLRDICMDKSINIFDQLPWHTYLPSIECNHNRCIHPATKYSPYELMTGRSFQFLTPTNNIPYHEIKDQDTKTFLDTIQKQIKIIHQNARSNQKTYDEKRFLKTNEKRYDNPFKVGQLVKVAQYHTKHGNQKSLSNKFSGPFTVTKIFSPTNIEILDTQSGHRANVHVRYVKHYYRRTNNNKPQIQILQIPKQEIYFQQLFKQLTTSRYKSKKWQTITRTPHELARKIGIVSAQLRQPGFNLIELFAGDGRITTHLPSPLVAVDFNDTLINTAKQTITHAQWIKQDLVSFKTIHLFLAKHSHKYTQVISNPPWEYGFWTILLAKHLLTKNKNSKLIILLPSDFFTATAKKRKLFEDLQVHIERQYEVGRWNYLADLPKTSTRIGSDSIFVISTQYKKTSRVIYPTEWY